VIFREWLGVLSYRSAQARAVPLQAILGGLHEKSELALSHPVDQSGSGRRLLEYGVERVQEQQHRHLELREDQDD
jgi:hypothetical protein